MRTSARSSSLSKEIIDKVVSAAKLNKNVMIPKKQVKELASFLSPDIQTSQGGQN